MSDLPGETGARRRVVVIGHGMAGAKFVDQLAARDPDGRIAVTVFGAEPHPAYNRALLSGMVAGQYRLDDIRLGDPPPGVDLRSGVEVTAIDRGRHEVQASDGSRIPYDELVLATGGQARIPPLDGLRTDAGDLLAGVAVFRTLDDCQRIMSAADQARRAVVLGGGLLGVEAARGLRARGLDVELVHAEAHLMQRQLDPAAGRVLARTLRALGIGVRLDAGPVAVLGDEAGGPGRVRAVSIADGTELPADLLVVACGVRPEVTLARGAGLDVRDGVVVDDTLRSVTDPRIYAVGECAEHEGRVYGLIAPAWEQTEVLADQLSGVNPAARYGGSRTVVRLRAAGVDLAAIGETANCADGTDGAGDDADVLSFTDLTRGTYKKVIIRDGRLVGAILLGEIATVGTVTQLFDRGGALPIDRLSLLFARSTCVSISAAPAGAPAGGTVCQCNGVSAETIRAAHLAGARTVREVAVATRATTGCGGCRNEVSALLSTFEEPAALPLPS